MINRNWNLSNKIKIQTHATSIQIFTGSYSQSNKKKRNKKHKSWMATSKIMFYIDNIILYIANSEEYIKTIKTNKISAMVQNTR